MQRRNLWTEGAKYWRTIPRGSTVRMFAGVFLLFTAFGLVTTFFSDSWLYVPWAILIALISGIFAIGWAYAGFRRVLPLLFVLLPLQFVANGVAMHFMAKHKSPLTEAQLTLQSIESRLKIEAVVMMFTIVGSYMLIVNFIRREGRRLFGPLTEVRLAREVHQTLVPELSCTFGGYEIYGISVPSGQVGGDLVDVIHDGDRWIAYVADVVGHGVPAGMIMAMVKSAVHMGVPEAGPNADSNSLPAVLAHLNRVLKRLSAPHVYATLVCIANTGNSGLQFSVAGHYPILHYQQNSHCIRERSVDNPPLAILPEVNFATDSITLNAGDLLAVVTDGLTEAANERGDELGLEPLKSVLLENASAPLRTVAQHMRDASLRHGVQFDDQTVLLIRLNR